MREHQIDPPNDSRSWPRCAETIVMFGVRLTCDLPAHHLLDGDQMHEDPEGGRWVLTTTLLDGREIRS